MLTPLDDSGDGNRTEYWAKPHLWRRHDPPLFDLLTRCAKDPSLRRVGNARKWGLISGALYYEDVLPQGVHQRDTYFRKGYTVLAEAQLVFFDPDTGLQ